MGDAPDHERKGKRITEKKKKETPEKGQKAEIRNL